MSQVWILHDSQPRDYPMLRIHPNQAEFYNAMGYGIFQTVNEFRGARRIENLTHINAWAIDIDVGEKKEQLAMLKKGLVPTLVIETKRGYQVYWKAKDATQKNWNAIVLDRLVPFYKADKNARDLARILRKPGYYHLKNPNEPFLVKKVWEWPVAYSEIEMASFYPASEELKRAEKIHNQTKKLAPMAGFFWDRVWHLDCEQALSHLSGQDCVKGEIYTFKQNASGTKNILVSDKSTSCWVDRAGRIGSLDQGGPCITNWLRWYGHDWKKVMEIMRQYFPELWEK